jgi:hypothetical protein
MFSDFDILNIYFQPRFWDFQIPNIDAKSAQVMQHSLGFYNPKSGVWIAGWRF